MDVQQYYDRNASKYLSVNRGERSPLPLIFRHSLDTIISAEGISLRNANVLDVGCGDGTFSRYLCGAYPEIHKIDALDLSQAMIDAAKQHPLSDSKIRYVQGDISKLSTLTDDHGLKPGSYDIAVVVFVYLYSSTERQLEAMIRNIGIMLKAGGCIVGINSSPDDHRVIAASNEEAFDRFGVRMYVEKGVRHLLDGQRYEADVYAFDDSKSEERPKGNYLHFDTNMHFWSRDTINALSKSYGFEPWKWMDLSVPLSVKLYHTNIDWTRWPSATPDLCFFVRKTLPHRMLSKM